MNLALADCLENPGSSKSLEDYKYSFRVGGRLNNGLRYSGPYHMSLCCAAPPTPKNYIFPCENRDGTRHEAKKTSSGTG